MSKSPESTDTPDTTDVDEILDAITDDTEPVKVESEEAQRQVDAAEKVPLHLVHPPQVAPVVRRKRGRPKKVVPKPTVDELEYHREQQAAQAAFVDADPLVEATVGKKDSAAMLQALKERLARMTAVLEFMRIEGQKTGKQDGQLVSRQVAAVREIAAIELKIRELGAQTIDVHSEPVQKILKLFVDKIRVAAKEVLSDQQFDVLWNRLETALDGWEEEAESAIR